MKINNITKIAGPKTLSNFYPFLRWNRSIVIHFTSPLFTVPISQTDLSGQNEGSFPFGRFEGERLDHQILLLAFTAEVHDYFRINLAF